MDSHGGTMVDRGNLVFLAAISFEQSIDPDAVEKKK